jgi:hypothetical protein
MLVHLLPLLRITHKISLKSITLLHVSMTMLTLNRVLPATKLHVNHTVMLAEFLNGLIAASKLGVIDLAIAHNIFRDLIQDLIEHFDLTSSTMRKSTKSEQRTGPQQWQAHNPDRGLHRENSRIIAKLFKNCLELELHDELHRACHQVYVDAKLGSTEFFESLWIPLLKDLSTEIQGYESLSPIRGLFLKVLGTYILNFVNAQPTPPKDWKRPTVAHNCKDCIPLNAFLADASQKELKFNLAKTRQKHVLHQLKSGQGRHWNARASSDPRSQLTTVTKLAVVDKAEYDKWSRRQAIAETHIQGFGEEPLRKILKDKFDMIWWASFKDVTAYRESQARPLADASSSANSRVLPPITKRKTPAAVPTADGVIELE